MTQDRTYTTVIYFTLSFEREDERDYSAWLVAGNMEYIDRIETFSGKTPEAAIGTFIREWARYNLNTARSAGRRLVNSAIVGPWPPSEAVTSYKAKVSIKIIEGLESTQFLWSPDNEEVATTEA